MQNGHPLVVHFPVAFLFVAGLATLAAPFVRGAWLDAVLGGIALGMALLPEEFPLVLAVFMVMGAWRLSRSRVLTRRAAVIETLGAATVLCTDKTGTLTRNLMSVAVLDAMGETWDPHLPASRIAASGMGRSVAVVVWTSDTRRTLTFDRYRRLQMDGEATLAPWRPPEPAPDRTTKGACTGRCRSPRPPIPPGIRQGTYQARPDSGRRAPRGRGAPALPPHGPAPAAAISSSMRSSR